MVGKTVNNRYKVLQKIGEGGMARVFLAEDTLDANKLIALKTIKTGKASADMIESFKHEFKVMTGLRHPNLVEVYDFGTVADTGEHFFTLEYVRGEDFFKATEGADCRRICELLVQLCRALDHIHSRGFIHHDLKPTNIMVCEEKVETAGRRASTSSVKLMDFGLTEEMTTSAGARIRGTVEYLAPEVAKGERVDRRVDLYSLGVVLYQAVTRKLPFAGDSITSILRQHLLTTPPPPTQITGGVSDVFDALIAKLIAKEPSQRYSCANDVIRAINSLTDSDYEVQTKGTTESHILSPRFLAREKELGRLTGLFEAIASREKRAGAGTAASGGDRPAPVPGLILIVGEEGIGKTRLAGEFRYVVQLKGGTFLTGRATHRDGQAYEPLLGVLRQLVQIAPQEDVHKHAAVLASLMGELAKLPGVEPPPELNPESAKMRLFDSFSQLAAAAAGRKPLVVFVEDMHRSDPACLEMLRYLVRNSTEERILVCGTCRNSEDDSESLSPLVKDAMERGLLETIALGKLPQREVAQLVNSVFPGIGENEEVAELFFGRTAGNPSFVQEMMRSLVDEGVIREERGQWRVSIDALRHAATPDCIASTVARRLARLTADEGKLLAHMAAFRKPATLDMLAAMLETDKGTILDTVRGLEKRCILVERAAEDGGRTYDFEHETMRATAYELLKPSHGTGIHERVGCVLENAYKSALDEHGEELAYHFSKSGNKDKALLYLLRAAGNCAKSYANRKAMRLYETALPFVSAGDLRLTMDILEKLGNLYRTAGEMAKAEECYRKILPLAGKAGDQRMLAVAFGRIGKVCQVRGELENAGDFARKAVGIAEAAREERLKVELIYLEGTTYWKMALYDKALERLDAGRQIAERIGDRKGVADSLNGIGLAYHGKGDYARAQEFFWRALVLYVQLGDKNGISMVFHNLGAAFSGLGEDAKSLAYFEKAAAMSEEIGDKDRRATCLLSIGTKHFGRASYRQARDYYEKALSISRQVGNRVTESLGLGDLAEIIEIAGEYDRAMTLCREELSLAQQAASRTEVVHSLSIMARLCRKKTEYAEAVRLYREATEVAREIGSRDIMTDVKEGLGDLYLRLGATELARMCFEEIVRLGREMNSKRAPITVAVGFARIAIREGALQEARNQARLASDLASAPDRACFLPYALAALTAVQLAAGEFSEAAATAHQMLAVADEQGAADLAAEARLLLGIAHIGEGQFVRAEKTLSVAVRQAQQMPQPELLWRTLFHLGRAFEARGMREEARSQYANAHDVLEQVARRVPDEFRAGYLADEEKALLNRAWQTSQEPAGRQEPPVEPRAPVAERLTAAPRPLESAPRRETPPQRQLDKARQLLDLVKALNSELEHGKVLGLIVDKAVEFFSAERGLLLLKEEGKLSVRIGRNFQGDDVAETERHISESVVNRVISEGEPIIAAEAGTDERFSSVTSVRNLGLRSIACIPLKVRGATIGAFYLDHRRRVAAFSEDDLEWLKLFADHAAIALENARLHREATRDRLTGLHTHPCFIKHLQEEIARSSRFDRQVSVLLLDIDRFKMANDVHGHEVGNRVIRWVASVVEAELRTGDVVAKEAPAGTSAADGQAAPSEFAVLGRLGGDEFEVILPETAKAGAVTAAERIRSRIAGETFEPDGLKLNLTVSIGVASFPEDAQSAEELFLTVDEALYSAKRQGRDKVFCADQKGKAPEGAAGTALGPLGDIDPLVLTRDGMTVLAMVSRIASAGIEMEKLLDLIIGVAVQATKAERGALISLDEKGKLQFKAARNFKDEEIYSPDFEVSHGIIKLAVRDNRPVLLEDALKAMPFSMMESVKNLQIRSVLCVPIEAEDNVIGVIYLDNSFKTRRFTQDDQALVAAFAAKVAVPLWNSILRQKEREQLQRTQVALEQSISILRERYRFENIVGSSKGILHVLDTVGRVSPTNVPVLILGESGTGKDLVAGAIHYNSPRKNMPLITINCAALTETLLESELFGHKKGAFTGATSDRKGKLEAADGGTVFLDEIGDMGQAMQAKLLRVLEHGEIQKVGADRPGKVDVRIIAATNRDLRKLIDEGHFREDLFHRLSVVPILIPPLRERKEDLPAMIQHIVGKLSVEMAMKPPGMDEEVLDILRRHHYPGNVRELENILRRAIILAQGRSVSPADLPAELAALASRVGETPVPATAAQLKAAKKKAADEVFASIERQFLEGILKKTQGNITKAAKLAGVDRTWLQKVIGKHSIRREHFRSP